MSSGSPRPGAPPGADPDLGSTLAAGPVVGPARAPASPGRRAPPLDHTIAGLGDATPAPQAGRRQPIALDATLAGPAAPPPAAPPAAPPPDRTLAPQGPSGTLVRAPLSSNAIDATIVGEGAGPSLSDTLRTALERTIFPIPGQPGKIHRFTVLRLLGEGGMGVVYSAYDEELDRRVAIKLVRDDGDDGSFGRSRILREAQAMAKVSHPNVVQVYEVGEFAGQVFVAMEFVKGVTLTDWLAEERPWQEIRDMFLQAGRGLAAAHAQGLVHRDFKPDNVLVGADGRARVLDFGLARREADPAARRPSDSLRARVDGGGDVLSSKLTLAGTIMGTPAYMSPEQHRGDPADARTDQFSLCVALHEAIYRQHPFPGESYHELSESVLGGQRRPPPPGSGVPEWMGRALAVGMAIDPADRYPSIDTLLADLAQDSAPPIARSRWLWPAVTILTAALAVLLTLALVGGREPSPDEAAAIERLVAEARDAAARQRWVYPGGDDPQDTAYTRIVRLEGITGDAAAAARAAARALRIEFADSLLVRGEPLYGDPATRPLARDFYVQALLFDPDNATAAQRAGVSLGQLADLRDRAGAGEFLEGERVIGSVQDALALADPEARGERVAAALLADGDEAAPSTRLLLARSLRRSRLVAADALDRAIARDAYPLDLAADDRDDDPVAAAPPAAADPPAVAEPAPSAVRPPPLRLPPRGKGPRGKGPAAGEDPDAEGASDPARSTELTREAEAARRRGDLAAAEQLFNQALNLWNRNAAAVIGLSDIAFDRGNFDRAVKYAEKAVRFDGDNGEYRIRLGDALFKVFRYDDAQRHYQRAAELGHPKAAERLARVKAKVGG